MFLGRAKKSWREGVGRRWARAIHLAARDPVFLEASCAGLNASKDGRNAPAMTARCVVTEATCEDCGVLQMKVVTEFASSLPATARPAAVGGGRDWVILHPAVT